jgi:Toprim-like
MRGGEHRHVREGWIGADCPFCGEVDKYHLGYKDGTWVCWICGIHRMHDVLIHLMRMDVGKARGIAKELRDNRYAEGSGFEKTRAGGKLILPNDLGPLRAAHRDYLAGRGFDPDELVTRWGVQGIGPLGGALAWRVWIPIHYGETVVSWTTRAIADHGSRYVSASPEQEKIRHKELLFGEQWAGSTVVVFEGPLDAIATGPGAVALCGVGYTPSQVLRLSRYGNRIVAFDNEPQAQRRAKKLARDLGAFPGSTRVLRLDAKDAASADPEELQRLREKLGTAHTRWR